MTARINSRPHSFTPYIGSSIGWTPETSRHTASTTAFHIMLGGCGDLHKLMFSALGNTTLYVSLFCSTTRVCDLGHVYKGGFRHWEETRMLRMQAFQSEKQIANRDMRRDLYGDKRWTKGCRIIKGFRDCSAYVSSWEAICHFKCAFPLRFYQISSPSNKETTNWVTMSVRVHRFL